MSDRHGRAAREALDYIWGEHVLSERVADALAAAERRGAERMRAACVELCRRASEDFADVYDVADDIAALDVDAVLAEDGDDGE